MYSVKYVVLCGLMTHCDSIDILLICEALMMLSILMHCCDSVDGEAVTRVVLRNGRQAGCHMAESQAT